MDITNAAMTASLSVDIFPEIVLKLLVEMTLKGNFLKNDVLSRLFSSLAQIPAIYSTFKNCNRKMGSPCLPV